MKTEEDVCDECVQFVYLSARKASTIINKEVSSTYPPVYAVKQYNYNKTHVLIDMK